MEQNNRPQGRQRRVTGSAEVHKRGEGLNTGPVGAQNSNPHNTASGSSGSSGGRRATRAGGGRGGLIAVVLAAVVALGGGGGLMGLYGGSGDSGDTAYTNTESGYTVSNSSNSGGSTSSGTNAGSGTSGSSGSVSLSNPYQSMLQQSAAATGAAATGAQEAVSTVAGGSREKRTKIIGGGKDQVTIMVYMCGTDLESKYGMGTNDLVEMSKARYGDNVHIVVYTGGCKKWNNNIVSTQYNQIYEVANGGLKCLVSNAGTGAMTAPATLSSFIQWAAQNYPANRNELILWDHGGGSVSGYGYDEKNSRSGSMSLAGVDQALKDAGVTFDFIGFDACLMATVETGLMLDNYADYMIASEETEPGIGWYYTDWLTALGQNTSMPTVEIGKNIVDSFVTTCASQCRGQSATLSVVDLAELSNTAPAALKGFSESLSTMISNKEYSQISTARSQAREFARSSAIDQIDLVDFAQRVGTTEAGELTKALQGAVKYNRTSSDMTRCYGLSIYFPYRKSSTLDSAVRTYSAIGMDDSYSRAIREFASLEVSGQVSTGGMDVSALPSLLGSFGGSSGGTDMISGLLGSFLSGNMGGMDFFSGRSLSTEDTVSYIADNYFDSSNLIWRRSPSGDTVIAMPEDQWRLVTDINVNLFIDDGEGFIDLGLDNVLNWDDDGNLVAEEEPAWLAVNGNVVAYYHQYSFGDTSMGYIPAMLSGARTDEEGVESSFEDVRVELLVTFDSEHPYGYISGARPVYLDGETETISKSTAALQPGDTLNFLCDYYSYDGEYLNSYYLGDPLTVTGELEISDVLVTNGTPRTTYRFTDIYNQHYWTEPLEG